MSRRTCTCPHGHREWYRLPHLPECPRHVDRSPMMRVRDAVLARHGDVHEWLSYTEAWRIDVFAMRTRTGPTAWNGRERVQVYPDYLRVAYEVKVSRGDFLSELKKPAKRRHALDVSHQFYFAVPKGLVAADEVPEECGLVHVYDSGKTRTIKEAPIREPREFSMEEIVYLARMPMYRSKIDELQRRVKNLEYAQRRLDARGVAV